MFYQRFDEWLAHNKKDPQSDKPPPPPETEIDNEIKVTAPWKEITFAFLIVLLLPLLIWYLIDQKNELLKPASPSVCRQILVPRLTDVPVQQGKRRLREAGVEIINETSQSSERIDSGRIITTQPAGGTCISRKQSIEITVSSGRSDLVEDLLILGGTVVDESGRALNGAHVMLADERWRQFYNLTDKPDSEEFISLDENASMMAFTVLSEYSSSRFASGSQIESVSAIPPEIAETLTASIKATDRTDSSGNFLMRTNSQPGLELIIARGGYFAVVYFDLPSQAGALTLQVRLTRENKQWWRDLQTNFTTIRMFLFLIPIILSIVWLMWRRKRRQLVLERKSAKDVDSVALNIAEPVHKLFANAEFVSARIEAYRHQRIGSGDLDEAATVKTTIEQMGYFTPVYKSRLQVPTYLALIDKAGFKDQQAKLIDEFLNHLEMGGVHIERYYFNQDPRICAPASQARVNQKPLKDLAARYANNRLLVFTDGRGMTHPVTGRLANWTTVFESWQERAVLTPLSPYYWGSCEIELATSGFRVNHASAAGLHLFAQSLNDENTSSVQTKEWQPKYPELLNADPGRWLEPNPPLFEDVNELLLQLRRYLGPDGYRWLCSLAVYPTLDWHLTLYLGLELKSDNGTSLLDDVSLLSLVRLTWLREGCIPDWLRTMLIKDLSKADEETIRNFLWNLLRDPLENAESKFTLDIAERRRPVKKPGYKAWYRALLRAEPDDSLLCDHVFVNFLLDKPRTSIQLAAPSTWRNLVFEKGIHTLGLRNGAGLTLGITLGVGLALTSTYAVQFLKPLALSESLSAVNRDNWSEYLQESLPQSSDEGGDEPVQQTSEDQDSALEQVIVTGRKVKTGETNTNFVSPRETQDIQRLLNEIGYPLNPDGLAGGRTHNAVVQFQDDFGFEVNGNLTQQLIEQLETINSIDRRVRKIVLEQLAVNEEVTMYASFVDDLGADSLDLVELVMALEEEFNTEIPDSEAELITTVFDATRHISRRVLANTEGSY